MGYRVLIAESAIADLREIVEFVAEDDPFAAGKLGEKLIEHALSLSVFPARHPFYDKTRSIRKLAVPPYLIYYVTDEPSRLVNILHFWHGARRSPDFR
jgi:addiction module RelE/StbE family toxin